MKLNTQVAPAIIPRFVTIGFCHVQECRHVIDSIGECRVFTAFQPPRNPLCPRLRNARLSNLPFFGGRVRYRRRIARGRRMHLVAPISNQVAEINLDMFAVLQSFVRFRAKPRYFFSAGLKMRRHTGRPAVALRDARTPQDQQDLRAVARTAPSSAARSILQVSNPWFPLPSRLVVVCILFVFCGLQVLCWFSLLLRLNCSRGRLLDGLVVEELQRRLAAMVVVVVI